MVLEVFCQALYRINENIKKKTATKFYKNNKVTYIILIFWILILRPLVNHHSKNKPVSSIIKSSHNSWNLNKNPAWNQIHTKTRALGRYIQADPFAPAKKNSRKSINICHSCLVKCIQYLELFKRLTMGTWLN